MINNFKKEKEEKEKRESKKRKRKKKEEKKIIKIKSCLAKKNMLVKRDNFQLFFERIH